MPFVFAYLLILLAYLGVGLILLIAALLLALVPRLRSRAKWLALGVLGSVAGVFTFQLAALPIVLAILSTLMGPIAFFHGGGNTTNLAVITASLGSLLFATGFFAFASLAGFITGWNAVNALGAGIAPRAFLASDRILKRIWSLFQRPYRLPLLIWLLLAWATVAASGLRCWLNSGVTIGEVAGSYLANTPAGHATLNVRPNGQWEYLLEGQSAFARTGKWTLEPQESNRSTVAIVFENFALGFPSSHGAARERPGFVFSYFSRDCAGKLRACFGVDDQDCFERTSTGRP